MDVNQLHVAGMLYAHGQFNLYLLDINEYVEYNKDHSLLGGESDGGPWDVWSPFDTDNKLRCVHSIIFMKDF